MSFEYKDWLISFDDYAKVRKDGRPFGDNTEMASRQSKGLNPWDENCKVIYHIGGLDSMRAIRTQFQKTIDDAKKATDLKIGERGHVYIAGWRLNPNRDISDNPIPVSEAEDKKNTIWFWISELMKAGVVVRIMLWLPLTTKAGFDSHINAHIYAAQLMAQLNSEIMSKINPTPDDDIGVVLLDHRVAEIKEPDKAAHHQKFIIIRGINGKGVAFCGGVDLAYTRRSAPGIKGDWQSGNNIPDHTRNIDSNIIVPGRAGNDLHAGCYGLERQIWFDQHLELEGPIVSTLEEIFRRRWSDNCMYKFVIDSLNRSPFELVEDSVILSSSKQIIDEPISKNLEMGKTKKGAPWVSPSSEMKFDRSAIADNSIQILYEGKEVIVDKDSKRQANAEITIKERYGQLKPILDFHPIFNYNIIRKGNLKLSYKRKIIKDLPVPLPITSKLGSSVVQAWQTIPLRNKSRKGIKENGMDSSPYSRGEFSIMAGLAKASKKANEIIFIFDQYFWDEPYARLLSNLLSSKPNLYLIIILPPHSDSQEKLLIENSSIQHHLRFNALITLDQLPISGRRKEICSLWNFTDNDNHSRGIYVHAKVQVFDDKLLVCGSSNINARSYTTDTELSCAVYDQTLIRNYYGDLWNYLFAQPIPSSINFDMPGWGKVFFDEFTKKVTYNWNNPTTNLIVDPWYGIDGLLPNSQVRHNRSGSVGISIGAPINNPFGLDEKIKDDIKDAKGHYIRQVRLDDIVDRLENFDDKVWRIPQ